MLHKPYHTLDDMPENTGDGSTSAGVLPEEVNTTSSETRSKSRKKRRTVTTGCVHIQATYNNTIVTFTDPKGNALTWASAGKAGFSGPKKSTPYAAGLIIKDAAERAKTDYGLEEVSVFVKGVGSGREAAIRALQANGMVVTSIKDVTPIPHNGCRAPRPRRV